MNSNSDSSLITAVTFDSICDFIRMLLESGNLQKEFQDCGIILEKCTPATLPVEYIDVRVQEDKFKDDSVHMQLHCGNLSHPFARTLVMTVPIGNAKILHSGGASSKKLVELSVNIEDVVNYTFTPGDAIGVLVSNSTKDVETVLESLKSRDTADLLCEVSIKEKTTKKNAKVPQHIPLHTSARAILRDCLDLRSVPKKLFLRSLAEFTIDDEEKKFLIAVSSKEGSKLYNELVLEKGRNFLDILQLCPHCCPPLSLLIEHLPRLKSRPYSVANSPLMGTGEVKIIFSVLSGNAGVATSFLTQKAERFLENPRSPPEINFYFRETNKFCYGIDEAKADSILIGIGCGVSPYLGLLEHKEQLMKQDITEVGSTWLFVGSTCQEGAVYREKLLDFKKSGVLNELHESFSRDIECSDFKHVQDQLIANAEDFIALLTKKETILYVCADGTTISKSIETCIKECLIQVLECSATEADVVVKDYRASGKYREDLWV